jgi:hypothetical protein
LDLVPNDQAAESARQELAAAFERGLLTTRVVGRVGAAKAA